MFWDRHLESVSLISRRKLNGPGTHWGVRLNWLVNEQFAFSFSGRESEVYDLQPQGIRRLSQREFEDGHPAGVRRELTDFLECSEAHSRLEHLLQHPAPYSLVDGNCEHFARHVVEGKHRSRQVETTALAGVGALALLALKAGSK